MANSDVLARLVKDGRLFQEAAHLEEYEPGILWRPPSGTEELFYACADGRLLRLQKDSFQVFEEEEPVPTNLSEKKWKRLFSNSVSHQDALQAVAEAFTLWLPGKRQGFSLKVGSRW